MRKHIKKHHINLGWVVFLTSIAVIFISAAWRTGKIELPASWIYYSRQLSGRISSSPKADVELNLNFHRQEHSLSCEAAALKMVLDYHGLNIPESEIINKMPFDPTPRSGNIWGDPDLGFVGDIDGKMGIDGYGIHWGPLAITAANWKKTKIIKNSSAGELAQYIAEGKPLVVWGYLGRGRSMTWKTPEGKTVNVINGEHTRVVYGFKGPVDNPEGFLVMDPTYGPAYWEKDKFMGNWDALGRTGIVVE